MEKRGCAVLSSKTGKDAAIEIDQQWSHKEVTEFLETLFPLPFQYAEKTLLKDGHRNNRHPAVWVLLNKEDRKLDIVPNHTPSGDDLH
jgi:hypothetical protein